MIIIKRPLVTILIGVIIGIIYGLYLKKSIAIIIILLALFLLLIKKNKSKKVTCTNKVLYRIIFFLRKRRKLFLLIFISIFFSNLYINFSNQKYEKLYKEIPKNIKTEATVVSEAKETEYYYSYDIKIKNKKFILYVKKSNPQRLKYGMQISLEGEYIEPTGTRNFKGFNYKEYLKTKKIFGSIKASDIRIVKENNVNIILKISNIVRNKIIETAENILPEETSGFLTGILIGEKNNISEIITENFSKSSLSHILAISGTHINYIILGITFILTKVKSPKKIKYIITITILVIFMFITQFSPSVVRACIMSIIVLFSKLVYRKPDFLTSISASMLIILIDNPFAIKDIGLQLSYLGTIGIVFLSSPINKFLEKYVNEKIAKMLAVTISAQIMVLPITIVNFNTVSTVFIISNIIAVPLVGVIILLGYINIIIGIVLLKLGKVIGIFTNNIIKTLMLIAEITSNIPFSSLVVATPSNATVIIYYAIIYGIYKKSKLYQLIRSHIFCKEFLLKRKCLIFYIVIVIEIINILPQKFQIHFVDVGQRRLYINKNCLKKEHFNRYRRNRKYSCRIFVRQKNKKNRLFNDITF